MDRAVAGNLNASNGLGVTWLEANRCSGCNVKSIAIRLDPIEVKLRIRLNEMVMRSDLKAK
jgi:predicted  nucleic acid-binding Zn-ribbon protein